MTRPHCTWSSEPGPPLRYAAGLPDGTQPGVFLGGTVLWEGLAQTIARLKALPVPSPADVKKPWMHLTLSLPPLVQLDDTGWMEVLPLMLDNMGFPARAVPWIAFEHPLTEEAMVRHAHLLGLPMTFSGRWLEPLNMKARCDRVAEALEHHLAIRAELRPPLALNLPKRRQTTPEHRRIAAAVDHVFQHAQPTGLDDLQTALWDCAEVMLALTPNSHGCPSYAFSCEGESEIRGKTLSNDLTPTAIEARFSLNANLRQARANLDLSRFLKALSAHAEPLFNLFEEMTHAPHAEKHCSQQRVVVERSDDVPATTVGTW